MLHRIDLAVCGGTLCCGVTHDVRAQRRMADERGDVDRGALALEHVEVLREGLEIPADARAQDIERHAFDLGEIAHYPLAVRGAAGRDSEATVADDGSRYPERRRWRHARVPRDLRVVVRMV